MRSGELSDWHSYLETLEDRDDVQLRDLFSFPETTNNNVVLEDDSLKDLYKKFTVSSMSLGALSEEAHQALAIAINQIGGKSGSGEGGEDPARFDNEKNSKIKQIASGRFGFTLSFWIRPDELMNQTSTILGCKATNNDGGGVARFHIGFDSAGKDITLGLLLDHVPPPETL